jgi:ubiquinone/menaquinone biosynthesis C-methylase UbiE
MQATTTIAQPSRQKHLVEAHFRNAAGFWRDIYDHDDVHACIHQYRRRAVLTFVDRLKLPSGSQVLEVGCGAGSTSVALAERGLRVTATDRVPEMTELTRRLAEDRGVMRKLTVAIADVDHLELPSGAFDAVLAIGVLPWLDCYEQALSEISRVLRPGGHFIVNTDNRLALHRLFNPRMNYWLLSLFRRFRARKALAPLNTTISKQRFESLLKRYGLEVRALTPIGFGPFSIGRTGLFSSRFGLRVNYTLQRMCERGAPLIGLFASQHLFLVQKK